MNDDRILEFMVSVSEHMQSTDRRFEQLINVVHDGFGRVTDQLQALNGRVDHLTEEVRELKEDVRILKEDVRILKEDVRILKDDMREVKQDIRDIKAEAQTTNRRLNVVFDQAGYLTQQDTTIALRVTHFEQEQQATNTELRQRLQYVENQLNKAS